MASCVMCGSWIPDDQGSRTCSMCYGDPFHGKDGYYLDAMRAQEEEEMRRRGDGDGEEQEGENNE